MLSKNSSLGKVAVKYAKHNVHKLLLTVAVAAIFGFVFYLYDIKIALDPLLYAFLLSVVLIVLYLIWDFVRFLKNYRQLECVLQHPWLLLEQLPEPNSPTQFLYAQLLNSLKSEAASKLDNLIFQRDEMLDYYTAWVHQIKTPIAALHLILDDDKSTLSGIVTSELLEVEQYVDMVLGYLRLESDSSDLVLHKIDVEPVLRRAVRKFAPQFIRKKLSLNFDELSIKTISDEKWLQFCIEQLLSNAIKYTAVGGVTISACGTAIVIEDTGIGIAPEDLPRICEKGFTGYNGRTDKKSTGIGLFLCNKALNMLGHALVIESTPKKGTKVTIELYQQPRTYE